MYAADVKIRVCVIDPSVERRKTRRLDRIEREYVPVSTGTYVDTVGPTAEERHVMDTVTGGDNRAWPRKPSRTDGGTRRAVQSQSTDHSPRMEISFKDLYALIHSNYGFRSGAAVSPVDLSSANKCPNGARCVAGGAAGVSSAPLSGVSGLDFDEIFMVSNSLLAEITSPTAPGPRPEETLRCRVSHFQNPDDETT